MQCSYSAINITTLCLKKKDTTQPPTIITGSIAHSAKCRYLSYSEADFEVFRPAGATDTLHRCGSNLAQVPSSMPNFTPIGATVRV